MIFFNWFRTTNQMIFFRTGLPLGHPLVRGFFGSDRNTTYQSAYDAKAFIILDDQYLAIPLHLGLTVFWLEAFCEKQQIFMAEKNMEILWKFYGKVTTTFPTSLSLDSPLRNRATIDAWAGPEVKTWLPLGGSGLKPVVSGCWSPSFSS